MSFVLLETLQQWDIVGCEMQFEMERKPFKAGKWRKIYGSELIQEINDDGIK